MGTTVCCRLYNKVKQKLFKQTSLSRMLILVQLSKQLNIPLQWNGHDLDILTQDATVLEVFFLT